MASSARQGVVLIGARGAGKSTVGPLLARRLRLPFLDADDEVEREAGRTVAQLLEMGEFRHRERKTLRRLLGGAPAVIAAGGGAVLWEGFAEAVGRWRVVWLDAPTAVLRERIASDPIERPSLTGRRPSEEIADLVRERAPLYEAVAWRRVPTEESEPETVAERIEQLLNR
ncbi:MAG: shikimate kinase [Planctomycetota bacterium]